MDIEENFKIISKYLQATTMKERVRTHYDDWFDIVTNFFPNITEESIYEYVSSYNLMYRPDKEMWQILFHYSTDESVTNTIFTNIIETYLNIIKCSSCYKHYNNFIELSPLTNTNSRYNWTVSYHDSISA